MKHQTTPWSSLLTRPLRVLLLVAALLLGGLPGGNAAAAPSPELDTAPVSIEGFISQQQADLWSIGVYQARVDGATILDETRGQAVVGAYVVAHGATRPDGTLQASSLEVLRPQGANGPVIEFSGVVEKITATSMPDGRPASYWVVGGVPVLVTHPETLLSGGPKVGWLVWVVALRQEPETVRGIAIYAIANRPDGVPVEFEGAIEKLSSSEWQVDGRTITLTTNTLILGTPMIGASAEVRARQNSNGNLTALALRVVDTATDAYVNAVVQAIHERADGTQDWEVTLFSGAGDDLQATAGIVHVDADTYIEERRAALAIGLYADIDGQQLAEDEVQAALVRLDRPTPYTFTGQVSDYLPARSGAFGLVGGQRVWLAAVETQQAFQAAAGKGRVTVHGVRLGNGVIWAQEVTAARAGDADTLAGAAAAGAISWTGPNLVAGGLKDAAGPALAYTPDRTIHALWEAAGAIYYARQPQGGAWSKAKRIGAGVSPALALDAAGQLHAVFGNRIYDNYEIYHIRLINGAWSLPITVSRTTGVSVQPVLVADKTLGMHAAWMDTTPGYWTIYTATWKGGFWNSYPVSNASGKGPALAMLTDGTTVLAWQSEVHSATTTETPFDIFISERHTDSWSIPVDLSMRPDGQPVNSIGVNLVAGTDGRVHVTWLEGDQSIAYNFGRGLYWPLPVTVAQTQGVARGPRIVGNTAGELSIAWDEGGHIRVVSAAQGAAQWPAAALLLAPDGDQKDVTLVQTADGITVGWVQTDAQQISSIYESRRQPAVLSPDLDNRLWLPMITR